MVVLLTRLAQNVSVPSIPCLDWHIEGTENERIVACCMLFVLVVSDDVSGARFLLIICAGRKRSGEDGGGMLTSIK